MSIAVDLELRILSLTFSHDPEVDLFGARAAVTTPDQELFRSGVPQSDGPGSLSVRYPVDFPGAPPMVSGQYEAVWEVKAFDPGEGDRVSWTRQVSSVVELDS